MKARLWHSDFIWDGRSFDSQNDIERFVNEYYPELQLFFKEWFGETGQIEMKTSGSTGVPKLIKLKRDHMVNSALATADFFKLSSGTKALNCLPLSYIAGRMMLVRSMVLGWHLDIIEPTSNPDIPVNSNYDFTAMVPLQLFNSYDSIENIETLIVGGGAVSDELIHKISNIHTKVFATYGMTETITHIALCPLNNAAGNQNTESIYKALPDVQLKIDDRNCLIIEAPKVSSEQVVTNDIVDLVSEDSFKWMARYDHVINSGGIKLIPELLEKKYEKLIKREFFVYGIPDDLLGEKLVLIIEGKKDNTLVKKIRVFESQTKEIKGKFEIPKEIVFEDKFKRTDTGKVNRAQTVAKMFTSD